MFFSENKSLTEYFHMGQKPLYVNYIISCEDINSTRVPFEMQVSIDSESWNES